MLGIKIQKWLMIVALMVVAGCASSPEVKRQRFFWPPLPDDPKIEWIGAYRSEADFQKKGIRQFMESVVGESTQLSFERPLGIASDSSGKVFVSDPMEMHVLVFDFNAEKVHVFGKDGNPFKEPAGIALDDAGNIYVADSSTRKILVFDKNEKPLRNIDISEKTKRVIGLTIDPARKRVIVADTQGHKIEVFDLEGKHLFTIGARGSGDGEFNYPSWVTLLKGGEIVVTDMMNARIQVFEPDGKFIRKFGHRGDNPGEFQIIKASAVDSENHIYVTDGKGNYIGIFSETGDFLLAVGGAYSAEKKIAPGGFLLPQGIFIDKNDRIFVVDQLNHRFQVFQYLNEKYLKENPVRELPSAPGKQ